MPEFVCKAGLFHSIYGTKIFKHKSLDAPKDRCLVRDVIGKEAEAIAFLFCAAWRPLEIRKVQIEKSDKPTWHMKTVAKKWVKISERQAKSLMAINKANAAEQRVNRPESEPHVING